MCKGEKMENENVLGCFEMAYKGWIFLYMVKGLLRPSHERVL